MTPALPQQGVVLDTNAALALWLFRDARLAHLDAALRDGALVWLQCATTQEELLHELRTERCERHGTTVDQVRALIDSVPSRRCPAPVPVAPASRRLRCSDPDDQVFIDLALAEGARWLLTRDKALLRLRRHAQPLGLLIERPEAWRHVP